MSKFIEGIVVLAASAAPLYAQAAIDVTDATTKITTDGTTAITAVGTALIGLAAVAVVYKWVKGSIFG